jgi:hypothetical protein
MVCVFRSVQALRKIDTCRFPAVADGGTARPECRCREWFPADHPSKRPVCRRRGRACRPASRRLLRRSTRRNRRAGRYNSANRQRRAHEPCRQQGRIAAASAGCVSSRSCYSEPDSGRRIFEEITDSDRVQPLRRAIGFLSREKFNWNHTYTATTTPGEPYTGKLVSRDGDAFMMRSDDNWILIGRTTDIDSAIRSGDRVEFRATATAILSDAGR